MRALKIIAIVIFAFVHAAILHAQDSASVGATKARCIIGLSDIKRNTNGRLSIGAGELTFETKTHRSTIPITSIENIYVGSETTDAGGFVGEAARSVAAAAPYDTGAVLVILMREKIDVLSLTYRDAEGGLHAAIFAMAKDRGQMLRSNLIAGGIRSMARKAQGMGEIPLPNYGNTLEASDRLQKPTPALRVEPVAPGSNIPAEYRLAIYEDVVERLQRSGLYRRVYRSEESASDNDPNLQSLVMAVDQFKQGSQTLRELTLILGATKVTMHLSLNQLGGESLLDTKTTGRVLFFGENLDVTRDAAKHVFKVVRKMHRKPNV